MSNLRGPELLIIVILLVLVFGARRLPDAARSLGRSLRIFRTETTGLLEGGPPEAAALPPVAVPEAALRDTMADAEAVVQPPVVPPTARK